MDEENSEDELCSNHDMNENETTANADDDESQYAQYVPTS